MATSGALDSRVWVVNVYDESALGVGFGLAQDIAGDPRHLAHHEEQMPKQARDDNLDGAGRELANESLRGLV
jgi:hypothetical protein